MKKGHLRNMVKGWFVGNFEPTVFRTNAYEVGIKYYVKGDKDAAHFHKIATEITVIQSGRVLMNGVEYQAGDIIVIEPGNATDFVVLEDTVTVVVKVPGAQNDKYPRLAS